MHCYDQVVKMGKACSTCQGDKMFSFLTFAKKTRREGATLLRLSRDDNIKSGPKIEFPDSVIGIFH
jgi:hypothetical protein